MKKKLHISFCLRLSALSRFWWRTIRFQCICSFCTDERPITFMYTLTGINFSHKSLIILKIHHRNCVRLLDFPPTHFTMITPLCTFSIRVYIYIPYFDFTLHVVWCTAEIQIAFRKSNVNERQFSGARKRKMLLHTRVKCVRAYKIPILQMMMDTFA